MPTHINACKRPDMPLPAVKDPTYLALFRQYAQKQRGAIAVDFYTDGPDEYVRMVFPAGRRQWYIVETSP